MVSSNLDDSVFLPCQTFPELAAMVAVIGHFIHRFEMKNVKDAKHSNDRKLSNMDTHLSLHLSLSYINKSYYSFVT